MLLEGWGKKFIVSQVKSGLSSYSKCSTKVTEEMERLRKNVLTVCDESTLLHSPMPHTISISLLNIRSIVHKEEYILCDNLLHNVICFTETWLHDGDSCHLHGLTHKCLRHNRTNINGGGLMMLVSNMYVVTASHTLSNHGIEILQTVIAITNDILLEIILVYRSPSSSTSQTIELLHQTLSVVHSRAITSTIVLGDFNEDLLSTTNKPIYTYMNSIRFLQYVNRPTTDYSSLLDAVYMKASDTHHITVSVVDCYYTDHAKIVVQYCMQL